MFSGMLRYCVNHSVSHHMGSHLVRSRPQRRNVQVKDTLHLGSFEEDLQRAIQESLKEYNHSKRSTALLDYESSLSLASKSKAPSSNPNKLSLKSRLKDSAGARRGGSSNERYIAERKKVMPCDNDGAHVKRTLRSSVSVSEAEELPSQKTKEKRGNHSSQIESKRSKLVARRTLRSGKPLSIECTEAADDQDSGCGSSNQSPGSDVSPISQHVDLSDGEISMKLSTEDAHTVTRVKARRKLCKRTIPIESGIQVPSFRVHVISSSYSLEGTEDLTDEAFEKMHHKLELDEKRRKRWDRQLQRDQELQERAKQKERQRLERNSPIKSMYPSENTVRQIELSKDAPVTLFRFPLAKVNAKEFNLSWVPVLDSHIAQKRPRASGPVLESHIAQKRPRTSGPVERTTSRKLRSSRRQH